MKRISFFIILSFFLSQICINQELPGYSLTDAPIVVDIDSVQSIPLNLSYIRYIPLETTSDCLIGRINKVLFRDDKIYVADFYQTTALYVFDMNGKFLFKISRMGKGPGEYISFRDFDIQANGDIYMFDHFGKKFIVFDPAGTYLQEFGVNYTFSHFCLVKDKMYWSILWEYNKMIANLAVYNKKEKKTEFLITDKKFLHELNLLNYTSYRFYSSPNGMVYFSPKFSEIIYSIDSTGVHPAIGIKNLNIPPDHVIKEWGGKSPGSDSGIDSDNLYFKQNIHTYETDRYITFQCITETTVSSSIFLYDKNSHSICCSPFFRYYTDIGTNGIRGSTGKYFFSYFDPNLDNEYHLKIFKSREELKEWKEEDNPVIVIFDLEI
ncbi:MAG: 6-bladed beta-propeller [Bacteroidales bacterium]|jgi:hypothetical protein|nr:6-bladed beta-propeller [Bacteroidales bacterium]